MDPGAIIEFANGAKIQEATEYVGLRFVCTVNYVQDWKEGRLYFYDDELATTIAEVEHQFYGPSNYDDETQGYRAGSRWTTRDGSVFVCSSATEDEAVWNEVLPYTRTSLTYASTVTPDCDDGLSRSVTMTGDMTINAPTNAVDGMRLRIKLLASGAPRELTFHASIKMPTGSTYEPTVASGATRIIELEYNGTAWMLVKNLEFSA